ncbi:50S ribosomal protein L19 [Candidatus Gottesmanbacteria bacterium]|nr:50S ribosomal protein L19 [Candidatus Gottesmanbacteria bacterium]
MANRAKIGETSFAVGDTVRVYYKIIEKEKVTGIKKREEKEETRERVQPFEGTILAIRGEGENKQSFSSNKTFTVRRIGSGGIGVERIFPMISPWITKVTVKKHGKVRRAKLYYLRKKETLNG